MFSQTSEYALRIVVFLASLDDNPATIAQIAVATGTPEGYLAKVLRNLARANIVRSQRGLRGGSVPAVTSNALAMVYGDIRRAYQIVDRIGLRILRDPYTDKPNVIFYTTKRVGGAVVNFEAAKILKIAAS